MTVARGAKMVLKKVDLQEQLSQAEVRISTLETELDSTKKEVEHLEEQRAADAESWRGKMEALERDTKLLLCREREEVRCSLKQAHVRELEAHGDLKIALELLKAERDRRAKAKDCTR